MANRFLEFYNDELVALRRRATRFAEAHPKIAGRLRLAPDTSDDPHVERMMQSFAYSAARVRQKLEDGLPELSNGLLETLYPHYLAPVPSLTVLEFAPTAGLESVQTVRRGTEVVSEPIEGDTCRFVTTQDILLAPVRLASANLMHRPFEAPPAPGATMAAACLRLTLMPMGRQGLDQTGLTRLRLFLSGPLREASSLARLMISHATGAVVARHANDAAARAIPASCISPVGFSDECALLPYPPGSFRGYRNLTEFACLPEKFLFFDIETGPLPAADKLELYIFFDSSADIAMRESLGVSVTLHAAPAINLFVARAEPVAIDGKRTSYPLQADARRPLTRQVHSVRRVTLAGSDGKGEAALPFFHRLTDRQKGAVYWQLERHSDEDGQLPGATSIALVDHRALPLRDIEVTAAIEVLATNANLPRQLPFGGGQPRLRMATPVENIAAVTCLRAPSPLRRAKEKRDRNWQLMSHLSLNHLSLTGSGAAALRSILRLYDPSESPDLSRMIDAIEAVDAVPGLAKLGGVMVAGTDVTISFDSQQIEPGEAVFFGAIIDRFLGCYTTINTFTRLTLRFGDRTDPLARFTARSGEEALV